ncbi:hypothetical protein PSYCIT7_024415 [Pseudomonas syringae Cit 7]|jgi:hypothetical protein|uniref:Lipoprotein n=1 Tax=Pseudomonas syringae Cit 7 TaxID=629264 RepID=A0A8T8LWX0_PSESX|nr:MULTISPECIES: hypothetical protein [Pseudomonas]MBC9745519.1 hypothetical protein [Pseudomonas syringae pv. syringae]MBC9750400.1 hypothetical protein [Pseudomonas syringae pv. syringae]MCK9724864.1 hypothetical protein [Pseudomonas syringae pv. syringae]MDU8608028.1 hypothetical protein [Pseudomonas syringae group sp. 247E2]PBP62254.1 hypothetical protein CCL18_01075 [Pseudomonas syringae]
MNALLKYMIAAFILLTGCEDSDMNTKNREIELSLGVSIDTVLASTSVKLRKDCDDTMCLYQFIVPSKSSELITVKVRSASTILAIENVSSTTIVTNPLGLITDIDVYVAGVSTHAKHEDAMAYFYQQVQNLDAAGWQRYIFPNEARIPGTEADKFTNLNEVLGKNVGTGPWMDPNLKLTKQVWVSLPMINTWMFYSGHEYLDLMVQRENSKDDPQNRGSYLFTWTFKSESEFYAEFVRGEDRARWRELLPAELTRMGKERQKTEAQLKKMGIKIDENYKDAKPPVEAG